MARVPTLAIALIAVTIGITGAGYMATRRPAAEAAASVVQIDRVARAVATTSATKTFKFTYSLTAAAGGQSVTMNGDGAYDLVHKLVGMNLAFDVPPTSSQPSSAHVTMEAVVDASNGFVEYLHMPLLDRKLPAGKSWVKIDVAELGKAGRVDLGKVEQGNSADPSKLFSYLRRIGNPVVVGHEPVGGAATTHYQAMVDLQKLADTETDAATRDNLRRAIQESGISSYPAEAWVDDAGYVRRMKVTIPMPVSGSGVGTMTMTEELSDFGKAVNVQLPPAESTVDYADVVNGPSAPSA